jgi:SagB-type dehydrogenase family enzyme
LLALRQGVYSVVAPDGGLHLAVWPHSEAFGVLTAGQRAVLGVLADGPRIEGDLYAIGREHDGDGGERHTTRLLHRLRAGGWLTVTVTYEDRALYAMEPLRTPDASPETVEPELTLSRFALLRRLHGTIVAESPRAWCDVRVHDPRALFVLSGLGDTDPAATAGTLPAPVRARILHDLRWAGIAVPHDDAENTELRLRQWSPHELWFHQRSRVGERGYFGRGFGRTFWAKDVFEPLPARHTPYLGRAIELRRPDLDALRRADPPLTTILEDRRSIRAHDDTRPMSLDQLGEFLYRCARTRGSRTADGVEYSSRPYPSGGSVYELELYPVVRHIDGLDAGMHHYDSHEHALRRVRDDSHPAVRRILAIAKHAALMERPPQLLIVIAARVGRLMWTYEQMPYSLILKHVGVLYQTMYSVATAMDLAPCALGSGDSAAFTEATGMDPFEECSVGDFVLGSRPVDPAAGQPSR